MMDDAGYSIFTFNSAKELAYLRLEINWLHGIIVQNNRLKIHKNKLNLAIL